MRSALFLLPFLVACRQGLTIPAESFSAYAAHQPVMSNEGIKVSLDDGGEAQLLPFEGSCLTETESSPRPGGGTLATVEPAERVVCAAQRTSDIRSMRVGPRLEVEGARKTLTAPADAVVGLTIIGANLGSTSYAPSTKLRSPGSLGAGIALVVAGLASGIGMIVAGTQYEPSGWFDFTKPTLIGLGTMSIASGAIPGSILIGIGGERMRAPDKEQPRPHFRPTGIGLEW